MVGGGVGKWLGDVRMICFEKQVRALGCLSSHQAERWFCFSGEEKLDSQQRHSSFSVFVCSWSFLPGPCPQVSHIRFSLPTFPLLVTALNFALFFLSNFKLFACPSPAGIWDNSAGTVCLRPHGSASFFPQGEHWTELSSFVSESFLSTVVNRCL